MPVSRLAVAALLVASAVNLALMIPGGFVETRDFSAYPSIVLGAFNVLLTGLGLGSLWLAYNVAKAGRGYRRSALAGLAFIGVYLLDLGRIFPVPSNPMSMLLEALEWIGTGLGVALTAAALLWSRHATANSAPPGMPSLPKPVLFGLALLALLIIAFATKSAMGI